LGFVVTMAVGVVWLGEPFSWVRVAACALIVAGVTLLALDA
jgi:multidrug transporter EmrE-like cation transporter